MIDRKPRGSWFATVVAVAAACLCFGSSTVQAEQTLAPVPLQQGSSNPLSFLDDKLILDVQERLRLEVRDNNFDFNSAKNASTDDTFLLQRFRLGLTLAPDTWIKAYVQGQDSRENVHNPSVSLRVKPLTEVFVELDGHGFWLYSTDDAWYRANGVVQVRPVNAAARQASPFAGSELDLTVGYTPLKWLKVLAGYSHFFAGSYLTDTQTATLGDSDADFGYVQLTVSF
jgi:hypothetical protein